jgi:hypothetical protein
MPLFFAAENARQGAVRKAALMRTRVSSSGAGSPVRESTAVA